MFWIKCLCWPSAVSREPCCSRRNGNHQAETRLFQEYVQPRRADAGPQLRRSLGDTHSVAESTEHTDTLVNQIKVGARGGRPVSEALVVPLAFPPGWLLAVVFLQAQRQCPAREINDNALN